MYVFIDYMDMDYCCGALLYVFEHAGTQECMDISFPNFIVQCFLKGFSFHITNKCCLNGCFEVVLYVRVISVCLHTPMHKQS